MPITKSAKKALRQSKKRAVRNLKVKRTAKRALKDLARSGDAALLPQAYKALDKAAKSGVIKKNTASRMKSRITKRLRKSSK